MMTSGSWRRNERSPDAKVRSIFALTWVCEMPSSWYSTGSSTVRMLMSGALISERHAYKVVVLPEPVGPGTSKMPCGRLMISRIAGPDRAALARRGRRGLDAHVDVLPRHLAADPARLRQALLGDVEAGHD